ncbi:MAG TPA: hypothetical protein VF691_10130 [Cytophagaceae bacterium]|jgi:predicted neutral ceramidase superfamily lipid hydrolase
MRTFTLIFVIFTGAAALFFGLTALTNINPLFLILLRMALTTAVIVATILVFRKNKAWSHNLPKEKRAEYERWWKNQGKGDTSAN